MTTITTFRVGAPDRDPIPEVDGYRIVRFAHGRAVFGLVPADEFEPLVEMFKAGGLDTFDFAVASAIEATLCATTPEGSAAWRREIDEQAHRFARGDRELAWVLGWDRGLSSLYLMARLGSSDEARTRALRMLEGKGEAGEPWRSPPADAESFGICSRLLDRFPDFDLGWLEVGSWRWAPVVARWPELEALYAAALTGDDRAERRLNAILGGLAASIGNCGRTFTTVDLSGLPQELFLDGHDQVLAALHGEAPPAHLPDRLYEAIPPAPGASVLLWSRDPEDATVCRAVRRAIEGIRQPVEMTPEQAVAELTKDELALFPRLGGNEEPLEWFRARAYRGVAEALEDARRVLGLINNQMKREPAP